MTTWNPIASRGAEEIQRVQASMLQKFLSNQVYPFSPYYGRMFDELGLRPDSFRSLDDLRRLPFTSKADFLPSDQNPDGYRSFVLRPDATKIRSRSPLPYQLRLAAHQLFLGKNSVEAMLRKEFRPVFMSATTGRSAEPVTFLYTRHDLERLEVAGDRLFDIFEVAYEDRVINLFPYAPHLAFWQTALGGIRKGVLTLSTGGGKVMGTEGNIRAIVRMKPTHIIGIPGYVYHLLRTAQEKEMDFSFVKCVILGAEKITRGMREKMVEILGRMGARDVSVFGTYGFTEAKMAWGECPVKQGVSSGYHTCPDMEIFEIVDPDTGEPVEEGALGEIVYTSLNARGSVVLRYRTGDIARGGMVRQPCPHCGRTVPRISSDIVRISNVKELNTTKIKGTLVNLNVFNEILSSDRAIDEWQLEIHKKNNDPFELDELVLNVSLRNGAKSEAVKSELNSQLQTATELTPNEINVLPLSDILNRLGMETELKERRIVDLRPTN